MSFFHIPAVIRIESVLYTLSGRLLESFPADCLVDLQEMVHRHESDIYDNGTHFQSTAALMEEVCDYSQTVVMARRAAIWARHTRVTLEGLHPRLPDDLHHLLDDAVALALDTHPVMLVRCLCVRFEGRSHLKLEMVLAKERPPTDALNFCTVHLRDEDNRLWPAYCALAPGGMVVTDALGLYHERLVDVVRCGLLPDLDLWHDLSAPLAVTRDADEFVPVPPEQLIE